jgi:hypothetical protein
MRIDSKIILVFDNILRFLDEFAVRFQKGPDFFPNIPLQEGHV